MRRCFIVAALLALGSTAHARPMPTLDLDSLLFWSESVVEGPITATRTHNYELNATVRVEKTWAGANLTSQTVTVGDLSLYSPNLPQPTITQLQKRKVVGKTEGSYVVPSPPQQEGPLKKGDHVLFFLYKPPIHSSTLPQATWWALSSGVYMVRPIGISGFTQIRNPGGYNEVPVVTRARFNSAFAASWTRVKDLKTHLRMSPQKRDVVYFQLWKARRHAMTVRDRWFSVDPIAQAVDERLKKIAQLSDLPHQTP